MTQRNNINVDAIWLAVEKNNQCTTSSGFKNNLLELYTNNERCIALLISFFQVLAIDKVRTFKFNIQEGIEATIKHYKSPLILDNVDIEHLKDSLTYVIIKNNMSRAIELYESNLKYSPDVIKNGYINIATENSLRAVAENTKIENPKLMDDTISTILRHKKISDNETVTDKKMAMVQSMHLYTMHILENKEDIAKLLNPDDIKEIKDFLSRRIPFSKYLNNAKEKIENRQAIFKKEQERLQDKINPTKK